MSNVLAFPTADAPRAPACLGLLSESVREARHPQSDVFWLKENAELLGMLTACGLRLPPWALDAYTDLYAQLGTLIRLHPQYYRFWLSICLDLEDLGINRNLGQTLCSWAANQDLVGAELSDLQRAEVRRLLVRRGLGPGVAEGGLGARLRRFIARTETFAIPNKKAAYELTHIVFYLSDYGRCDPHLESAARQSLEFAGLLAYLDQDIDLLAEICLAMQYAGGLPHRIWRDAVAQTHAAIQLETDDGPTSHDGYHAYLVTGWALQAAGRPGFTQSIPRGRLRVSPLPHRISALHGLAQWVSSTERHRRRAGWPALCEEITGTACSDSAKVIENAVRSSPDFDAFFDRFARA